MTKKDIKKQRIKSFLLKTLHIICYILSVLFIVCAFVGGIQACKDKNSNNVNEPLINLKANKKLLSNSNNLFNFDNIVLYSSKFNGDTTLDSEVLKVPYNIPTGVVSSSDPQIYRYIDLRGSYAYFQSSFKELLSLNILFSPVQYYSGVPNYYYQVEALTFGFMDGTAFYLARRTSTYYVELHLSFDYIKLVFTESILDDWIFKNWFYSYKDNTSLIFNKQWNYNAPLNTNIQGVYGNGNFTYIGPDSAYNIYNTGYFLSNNQLFNQIKIWFFKTGAIDVLMSENYNTELKVSRAPSGYYVYAFTEYNNTDTNYSIVVNVHDQVPYKTSDGGYTYYYANSSTWKNDAFRYVTFLQPLSDSLKITLNSFNNNNQNYYSGQIYNDGSDVFTLLSLGFSALADFWAISILPGISIGVLFFLPAVVGVIIIIVHLLRK